MTIPLEIESNVMIQGFPPLNNVVKLRNHYIVCIPLNIESQHMIQGFPYIAATPLDCGTIIPCAFL